MSAQLELGFKKRGGKRKGAGRKPRVPGKPQIAHVARERVARHNPVHVTLKALPGRGNLRSKRLFRVVRWALVCGSERLGFRVIHFSAQGDHIHMICEADSNEDLSRGMQGLSIRIARGVNRLLGLEGQFFKERYHFRVLRTPRDTRNAIAYVLLNGKKHGSARDCVDPCSSGPFFQGWREGRVSDPGDAFAPPEAGSWLLRVGWLRHGLISRAPFS